MTTDEGNGPLFSRPECGIGKIGIVVRDAIGTAKRYAEIFGLGPWSFFDLENTVSRLQDRTEAATPFGLRVATGMLGQMGIELLQPIHGPSSYAAFLERKGEGIQHLSFGALPEYGQLVAGLEAQGIPIEMQARWPGGKQVTQFGSPADLGTILEVTDTALSTSEPWGTYQPENPGWVEVSGRQIAQIGIVVEDAERVARRWWHLLGIGPWEFYDFMPPIGWCELFRGVEVRRDTPSHIRAAIAVHSGLEIELLQPLLGPGTHMDFLRNLGAGAHHASFGETDDLEEFVTTLRSHGLGIEMAGTAGPAFEYTYLETQHALGTVFEVLKFDPEADVMAGLYGVYPPPQDTHRLSSNHKE